MDTEHSAAQAQRPTFTIRQFCDGHNISQSYFFELVRHGRGPRRMRVGKRVLISAEAAAEWRRAQETAGEGA